MAKIRINDEVETNDGRKGSVIELFNKWGHQRVKIIFKLGKVREIIDYPLKNVRLIKPDTTRSKKGTYSMTNRVVR